MAVIAGFSEDSGRPAAQAGSAIAISERFALGPHLAYMQKGWSGEGDAEVSLDYFEIPVLIMTQLPLSDAVGLQLGFGPSLGFQLSCDDKQPGEETRDCGDDAESTDFSVVGAAGLGFAVSESFEIFAGAGYMKGLTDVAKSEEEIKNTGFQILAGFSLPLGGGM